jgi:asparagine N-glycosylation enzyme membrane subunit Stt3
MSHFPVNHRLRPLYRGLAFLAGAYLLLFGIIGAIMSVGDPFFDRGDTSVLGLKTNMAFSVLSIVVGAIVAIGAIYGRNIDHFINMYLGGLFMAVGVFGLIIVRSDLNKLNYSVSTCVVSSLIGTVLLIAGLYGKTGTPEQARHEEELRVPSKKAASA